MSRPQMTIAGFWETIRVGDESECWLWTGPVWHFGHGRLWMNGRARWAHRMVWELTKGPIPADMCVCHHCDVPACCNPAHLFLGTKGDNNRDRSRKGRTSVRSGEAHWLTTLTDRQCEEIIARYAAGGVPQWKLGQEYGVSQAAISRVIRGETRPHLARTA